MDERTDSMEKDLQFQQKLYKLQHREDNVENKNYHVNIFFNQPGNWKKKNSQLVHH